MKRLVWTALLCSCWFSCVSRTANQDSDATSKRTDELAPQELLGQHREKKEQAIIEKNEEIEEIISQCSETLDSSPHSTSVMKALKPQTASLLRSEGRDIVWCSDDFMSYRFPITPDSFQRVLWKNQSKTNLMFQLSIDSKGYVTEWTLKNDKEALNRLQGFFSKSVKDHLSQNQSLTKQEIEGFNNFIPMFNSAAADSTERTISDSSWNVTMLHHFMGVGGVLNNLGKIYTAHPRAPAVAYGTTEFIPKLIEFLLNAHGTKLSLSSQ